MGMKAGIGAALSALSGALGAGMPALLFAAGAFFLLRLRFFPLRHPRRTLAALTAKTGGASSFRALTVALAGTLGVGNVTGVALAISEGGAGAVFWMWVTVPFAMMLKYAETALATAHRRRERGGSRGGMMYVFRDVLPGRAGVFFGGLFAALCLAAAFTMGSMVQSGAAAGALAGLAGVPPAATGAVLCLLSIAVLSGRENKLADVTVKLVPAFTVLYLAVSLFVILPQADRLPRVLSLVCREALCPRAAAGSLPVLYSSALRQGVSRGLLSNEAGCGTAPMAHAAAAAEPYRQGVMGMAEVLADGALCTVTSLVVLLAYGGPPPAGEGGVHVAVSAFGRVLGAPAAGFVALSLLFFAFSTVLCWGYYAVCAVRYFTSSRKTAALVRVAFCLSAFAGALFSPAAVFAATDLVLSMLCFCNLPLLCFRHREIAELSLPLTRKGT